MKLRFFSYVHRIADVALWVILHCERGARAVRVWAWVGATKENLRTCNERQPRRELFL